MNRKFSNKVLGLVTLLVLPLLLQTVHVLHVHAQSNANIHCHHHQDKESDHADHEHEECLVCDFEFSLFADDVTCVATSALQISYTFVVNRPEPIRNDNRYFLQPLRGPPSHKLI